MIAQGESWPLTMNSESQITEQPTSGIAPNGIAPLPSSGRPTLSIVTVGQNVPMPPRYADINKIVARAEQDPRKKAALGRARKKLAASSYKGSAQSIAAIRLRYGWSQVDLSLAMGTSQPHVARIESGDDVRISTVLNVAKALRITSAEAFNLIVKNMRLRG